MLFTSAPLCFTGDSLLEFTLRCERGARSGLAHAHWRVGRGPFTQTHLRKVLQRAAGSNSGLLSRRKRNVNNNPQFQPPMYQVSIAENQPAGTFVVVLKAADPDEGEAGRLEYFLEALFDRLVDRETVDYYVLLGEANEQGRDPGPRSATASVHNIVEDDNDNAPQFSEKRYIVQIPEDLTPNTEILQVTATDQDRGNNAVVHFSIMSGNTRGQFYIDAQTGKLDLVSQLDYEMNKEYTLRIRAQDGGRPPLSNISGLVTVQVLDVNDNAPIFVSTPFQATVLENVPVGYSVIHIQAIDADAGDNSRLEYRLTETTPNFPFTINNSTGWIVVASELDRESVDFYSFGVEARDHGAPAMSSSASISMTILDVNDNNPEFTQKAYYMRLNEDASIGTSVVTVSAVDQDINSIFHHQPERRRPDNPRSTAGLQAGK
uniref:Cadherin domain-containing protein n=1 Tax=Cyprinus carpio TaxID=7962 RepID=A0A8C2J0B9_CYPCA